MLTFSANDNGAAATTTTRRLQSAAADAESPVVTIVSPTEGQSFVAGATASVIFRASDNVGVVSQNILISTDGVKFNPVFKGLDGSVTSIDFTLPMTASVNAALRVEAVDAAGNTGFAVVNNLSLLADVQSPTVIVISPQANMKFKGNKIFTVSFRSADNVGIVSHEIRIALDGKNFTPFISGVGGDEQSLTLRVPNIKAKAAVIRVIAKDAAGNTGTADSGAFIIKRVK